MKGILFKHDMIQAVVEGKKTQTRRVIYPQPEFETWSVTSGVWRYKNKIYDSVSYIPARYKVGEVVYIKEAWRIEKENPIRTPDTGAIYDYEPPTIMYKVDKLPHIQEILKPYWKSPLFMPAWAARYFIKITDVRPERLQDISSRDIEAEGIRPIIRTYRAEFQMLWNSINKDHPWESNPWVWRYEFERIDNEKDTP